MPGLWLTRVARHVSAVAAESQFLMALELAAYPMQASSAPVAFRWPPLSWRMLTAAVSVIPFAWLGVVLNGTYAIPVNLLTLVALILMWRGVETGFDRLAGTR